MVRFLSPYPSSLSIVTFILKQLEVGQKNWARPVEKLRWLKINGCGHGQVAIRLHNSYAESRTICASASRND